MANWGLDLVFVRSGWEIPGDLGIEPGKDRDLSEVQCYRIHHPKQCLQGK